MFATFPITYNLNGGTFLTYNSKEQLKHVFLWDFYHFIAYYNPKIKTTISFAEFEQLSSFDLANYKIDGIPVFKYYCVDEGNLRIRDTTTFIGYLFVQGLYMDVIGHLISFFYRWRDIEEVDNETKERSVDFFANSWAALVDSIKYFNYNSMEDIVAHRDSPLCGRDLQLMHLLTTYPANDIIVPYKTNRHAFIHLPNPVKDGKTFKGWLYKGEVVTTIPNTLREPVTLDAVWE